VLLPVLVPDEFNSDLEVPELEVAAEP